MSRHLHVLLALVLACTLGLAACGGDDGGGAGGEEAINEETGATEGAKVIDPASMESPKGEVTLCTGKDTAGEKIKGLKDFEKKYPGVKAKALEFPESADEQRNQIVQRFQAKASDCDVIVSDVIWTAEFASQKWLYDLTPYLEARESEFVASTLENAKYDGKFWGVPRSTNAGFLFYRTDKVDQAPETWQEVYDKAKETDGIVYQGKSYEGLTVNFLEYAFSAGGRVLSEDGKKAEINSEENVKALELMVEGIESGAAPKANTTYAEEESRRAFEAGRATFMRNWPYAYGLGNESKIKGKFKVAPLPAFEGGEAAQIIGGDNLAISAFSENPGGALALVDYWTSEEKEIEYAAEYSLAPVLTSVYEDPSVKKAQPFAAELLEAVSNGKPRPVSPVYPQISQAIYKNVSQALSGKVEPKAALDKAQQDMEKALATF